MTQAQQPNLTNDEAVAGELDRRLATLAAHIAEQTAQAEFYRQQLKIAETNISQMLAAWAELRAARHGGSQ